MAEYIDRESFKNKYLCCGYLPEMSESEFDAFPAADIAPVVRGHWEVEKEDWGFCEAIGRNHVHRKFRCSVCGYATGDQAEKFVCCPICTARMDGGNHEAD